MAKARTIISVVPSKIAPCFDMMPKQMGRIGGNSPNFLTHTASKSSSIFQACNNDNNSWAVSMHSLLSG